MATKKQKRAEALAKREAFIEKVRAEGLKALAEDRARQSKANEIMTQAAKEINARHQSILKSAFIMNQLH